MKHNMQYFIIVSQYREIINNDIVCSKFWATC